MTNTETEITEYTIDAAGRRLGRIASEVATLLIGKNLPNYRKNKVMNVSVTITNAHKMDIDQNKLDSKEYKRFSDYPGGTKTITARELAEEKGHGELIRKAVEGMLPKNKLQSRRMKNLHIEE